MKAYLESEEVANRKIAGEERRRWYDRLWISGNSNQSEESAK